MMRRLPHRFLRMAAWSAPAVAAIVLYAGVQSLRIDPNRAPKPLGAPGVVASGQVLMPFSGDIVAPAVAFAPDGRTVAVGRFDVGGDRFATVVTLCDAEDGRARKLFEAQGGDGPCGVAFSPDGRTLAVGTDETVWIVDARSGERVLELRSKSISGIHSVGFSADGRKLAAAASPEIVVWDLETTRVVADFRGSGRNTYAAAFSPDGKLLATAGGRPVHCVLESPNNPFAPFFRTDPPPARVILWKLPNEPQGLPAADEGVWAQSSQAQLQTLPHRDHARAVAFSPDGRTLASGGLDGLRLWSLPDGRERRFVQARIYGLAYSPDGRTLALLTGVGPRSWQGETAGEVWLMDAAGENVRTVLQGVRGELGSLAFSPDGRAIVAGGSEGLVRWELEAAGNLPPPGRL